MAEPCEPCDNKTPVFPAPEPCPPPSTTIEGDVNVDISTEDINELVDKLCGCIEQQTSDLCTCITTAANLIVDAIANQPTPPVVVPLASQPCVAVGGVVDPTATLVVIDGVLTLFTVDGEIPAGGYEILDQCDPRCGLCACEPVEDCCADGGCVCTEQDLAAIAVAYGKILS